ncbi:MAG TPA: c-type cytochrome [Terriglobales bacterium]|nr:c-type cytochrome [Terriglobales bacterium]
MLGTRLIILLIAFALPALAQDADLARGEEIARTKCDTCHTLRNAGKPVVGFLAGGKVFGSVASHNLTPDPSGIPYFDEKLFFEALRESKVGARKLKPVMLPVVKRLSDDDLRALFAYLKTIPPVRHRVDNTEPPTFCKLCKQRHGAGDRN